MSGEPKVDMGTAAIAANGRVDRNVGRLLQENIMELTMSMFATQADYWKARAEIAERALADLGVTPNEARAGVERSKASQMDAERYRFLRADERDNGFGVWNLKGNAPIAAGWMTHEELDAAIDAAIALPPNA